MAFSRHVFRGLDVRGLSEEVTGEVACWTAHALIQETSAKRILLGRDMRATSPGLARAILEFCQGQGVDVVDIGLCTSSVFNYAVTTSDDVQGGLMITASHNPAEYNGIKIARANGSPLSGAEILAYIDRDNVLPLATNRQGLHESRFVLNAYLNACTSLLGEALPPLSHLRVVVDYGNGMGAYAMKPLLERLGLHVTALYEEPDARFPHHEANPAKEETLRDLRDKVLEEQADFGIATDGDGDRIGFVSERGEVFYGDDTLALLAEDVLLRSPGGVVCFSCNSSWKVEEAIIRSGGTPIRCPVGRTKIIREVRERGALLGGEVSSHFFFPEFSFLESIDFALLRVLCAWQRKGGTFGDALRGSSPYVTTREMNFHVSDADAALHACEAFYENQASEVSRQDGIRYVFEKSWWILLRKSNTEPLLRVTIEAENGEVLAREKEAVFTILKPFIL